MHRPEPGDYHHNELGLDEDREAAAIAECNIERAQLMRVRDQLAYSKATDQIGLQFYAAVDGDGIVGRGDSEDEAIAEACVCYMHDRLKVGRGRWVDPVECMQGLVGVIVGYMEEEHAASGDFDGPTLGELLGDGAIDRLDSAIVKWARAELGGRIFDWVEAPHVVELEWCSVCEEQTIECSCGRYCSTCAEWYEDCQCVEVGR